jgi:hypothetical protein
MIIYRGVGLSTKNPR